MTLHCRLGWHRWQLLREVYWCQFYRCVRCLKERTKGVW